MRRLLISVAIGAAIALSVVQPAAAGRHVRVYLGKLGGHGAIRIDVAGSRARVYFDLRCITTGTAAGSDEDVGTSPLPGHGFLDGGTLEPIQGHIRAGRLSIDETEAVETHDEFNTPPDAAVVLAARFTSRGFSGHFSLEQSASPGLDLNPAETIPGCSSGTVKFTARAAARPA